jgi:hypothetical protein
VGAVEMGEVGQMYGRLVANAASRAPAGKEENGGEHSAGFATSRKIAG